MNVDLFKQPNEYTCGPAAVYMLSRALGKANSFDEISRMCWANPVFGSLPFFVKRSLAKLGFNAQAVKVRRAAELQSLLDNAAVVVLTLFDGYPHWILVTGVDGHKFQVADPSRGKIKVSVSKMDQWLDQGQILPKFKIAARLIGSAYQVQCPIKESRAYRVVAGLLDEGILKPDYEVDELINATNKCIEQCIKQGMSGIQTANALNNDEIWKKHRVIVSSKREGPCYARMAIVRGQPNDWIIIPYSYVDSAIHGDFNHLVDSLRHEYVHKLQQSRRGGTKGFRNQYARYAKLDKYVNGVSPPGYFNDPDELMAYAQDAVLSLCAKHTKPEILAMLRNKRFDKFSLAAELVYYQAAPKNYQRFLNYAYKYAQELPN